jgi:integrase
MFSITINKVQLHQEVLAAYGFYRYSKVQKWTAHDLRRTFATQLGETLNVDPVVVEKCLGHKMPRIMATYNKNEMLPQRKDGPSV